MHGLGTAWSGQIRYLPSGNSFLKFDSAAKTLNYEKILPGRSEVVFVSSSEFCVNWFRFHLLIIFYLKVTAIFRSISTWVQGDRFFGTAYFAIPGGR